MGLVQTLRNKMAWISKEEYDAYGIPGLTPQGKAVLDRLGELNARLQRIEALLDEQQRR